MLAIVLNSILRRLWAILSNVKFCDYISRGCSAAQQMFQDMALKVNKILREEAEKDKKDVSIPLYDFQSSNYIHCRDIAGSPVICQVYLLSTYLKSVCKKSLYTRKSMY